MNEQPSVMTVDEFCQVHRISRGTFYNLLKAGNGPTIMKFGNSTRVSYEAAARWRCLMENRTPATLAA